MSTDNESQADRCLRGEHAYGTNVFSIAEDVSDDLGCYECGAIKSEEDAIAAANTPQAFVARVAEATARRTTRTVMVCRECDEPLHEGNVPESDVEYFGGNAVFLNAANPLCVLCADDARLA